MWPSRVVKGDCQSLFVHMEYADFPPKMCQHMHAYIIAEHTRLKNFNPIDSMTKCSHLRTVNLKSEAWGTALNWYCIAQQPHSDIVHTIESSLMDHLSIRNDLQSGWLESSSPFDTVCPMQVNDLGWTPSMIRYCNVYTSRGSYTTCSWNACRWFVWHRIQHNIYMIHSDTRSTCITSMLCTHTHTRTHTYTHTHAHTHTHTHTHNIFRIAVRE